jgi:hypothetical protein
LSGAVFQGTRPSLPTGVYRIWAEAGTNIFTKATLVKKTKPELGSNGTGDFTDYEMIIDNNDRNDIAFYTKTNPVTGYAFVTMYWYQNLTIKPDDGCDVVITDAFLVMKPSAYWETSKKWQAWAVIGQKDMSSELASQEFTNLVEDAWGDYKVTLNQFLFNGDYALGVALKTEVWGNGIQYATAVLDAGFIEFRYFHAHLGLVLDKTTVKTGQTVKLSGVFTKKDISVPNAMVYIKAKDPSGNVQTIASPITDSTGYYSYNWYIPTNIKTGTWTLWAEASTTASPQEVKIYSHPILLQASETEVTQQPPPTEFKIPWEYIAIGALVLGGIAVGAALKR